MMLSHLNIKKLVFMDQNSLVTIDLERRSRISVLETNFTVLGPPRDSATVKTRV